MAIDFEDSLQPEYDLAKLRVRKIGAGRAARETKFVQLAADVAEVFPDSDSVNEALRFLIRITKENKLPPDIAKGA